MKRLGDILIMHRRRKEVVVFGRNGGVGCPYCGIKEFYHVKFQQTKKYFSFLVK
jgi:DNA-directed RNA polymerase subunit RPC12/RpoP